MGFYEDKKLKFAGRVGTGFSDKLLQDLSAELNKIRVEPRPFFNLPAAGRTRWDQGLSAAEMKRCRWVKPVIVCQIKFTELTRDDRLRQPVFLGIRTDKNAEEVVLGESKLNVNRYGSLLRLFQPSSRQRGKFRDRRGDRIGFRCKWPVNDLQPDRILY